jgi:pimeloyl-ACP methyl ester carboxylesterase
MIRAALLTLAVIQPAVATPTAPDPPDTLHVVSAGTGPAVVLIPGLFGSAFGFRRVVPLLEAAGFRTVIVEPLGVGYSSRPSHSDYSLSTQSDLIAAVLDTLKLGPAVIVAHSLGGAIALRLAVRHPDLVRGVVSLEGGPTEQATTAGFRRAMKLAPVIRLLGRGFVRSRIRGMLQASSGNPAWVTDSVVEGYTDGATHDLGATIRAFKAMGRSHEPDSLAPALPRIHCPVRLIVGEAPHDGGVDSSEVALMHREIPSFAVDSLAGVGHYIHEERPDAVVASVERLIASLPLAGNDRVPTGGADAHRPRR